MTAQLAQPATLETAQLNAAQLDEIVAAALWDFLMEPLPQARGVVQEQIHVHVPAAAPPRKRAPRAPLTEECQACCDTKAAKVSFIGAPLCAQWKPCASRIRRNRDSGSKTAFMYDGHRTRRELNTWVVRDASGDLLASHETQPGVRALAYQLFVQAKLEQLGAAQVALDRQALG